MPDVINIGRKNRAPGSIGIIQLPNIQQIAAVAAVPSGVVTVTLGTDTFGVGFFTGIYGSVDTQAPNPPVGPSIATWRASSICWSAA